MSFEGFELPTELQMLKDGVGRFVQEEIKPLGDSLPADAAYIPQSLLEPVQRKAKEAGYWMFTVPKEYGGQDIPIFWSVVLTEEMSKHKFSIHGYERHGPFGPTVSNSLLVNSDYIRERYGIPTLEQGLVSFSAISEPSGGSDPARAIKTTATRKGDKYVLNGRKMWATNADIADYGIVYARTDTAAGRAGISAFVVDAGIPGMHVTPVPVIRDHHSTEIVFEDCEIPAENLIGAEGQGFATAQKWLVAGRLHIAAVCVGIAEEALRMTVDWVKQRETFGAPLSTRQAIQFALADAFVDIRTARWLTWDAAWKADQEVEARVEASIAKLHATEMAFRVVDMAMQFHGGLGMAKDFPLERWYRGIRVWRVGEGPSEVHRYVIARDLLGQDANR